MKIKKICQKCGKEFTVNPSKKKRKFCSKQCHYSSKHIIKKCKICNKNFDVLLSISKETCSEKCGHIYRIQRQKARFLNIKKICPFCKEKFQVCLSLDYRKYCSQICYGKAIKGRKLPETHRQNIIKALTGRFVSKKTREKMRDNWQNPEYVKKIFESRSKNKRPTKPEKVFNDMTSYLIRYVGNGIWWRKLPDGKYKNPDFKIKGQNKVIEIWGDYWHKDENPQKIINLFNQIGFDCLVIWENEIYKQPGIVIEKVNNFMSN